MDGNKQTEVSKKQVPAMIVTEDTTEPYNSGYEFFDRETRWNDTHRGPILRLVSTSMELVLKYNKKHQQEVDKSSPEPDFENSKKFEESKFDFDCSDSAKGLDVEADFIHEIPEPFSATPKCKQMRLIVLTNEGTTTIRYQWLRFPPSKAMRTMLANPRYYLNLSDENGEQETTLRQDNSALGYGNNLSKPRTGQIPSLSDIDYSTSNSQLPLQTQPDIPFRYSSEDLQKVSASSSIDFERAKEIIGKKPGFLRDSSFDFHFREMPGMLLPGQKVEIPILYRPRQPGYCHENLFLLTHPRLTDENDKTYMARLTGICMEPDCTTSNKDKDTGKERSEPECVKRAVTKTMLELEGADLIDSVLDHALYMHRKRKASTLPSGKLTPESIFYAHNPQLYYHHGVSERALKTVRKVVQVLIPIQRIQREENEICPLSIKDLYSLLWSRPEGENFFRSRFKTTKTEKLLRTLAKCSRILIRPPIYAYSNAGARKHMACNTNMIAVMDCILEKMDSIKENFTETPLYRIQRGRLEQSIKRKKLREYNRVMLKKQKQLRFENANIIGTTKEKERKKLSDAMALNAELGEHDTVYDTDFPVTTANVPRLANPPIGEGTKEVGPNVLPVENLGTPTEEEKGTHPGAEMESKDEELATALENTQETEEEADVAQEVEEEKEVIETKRKKNSSDKNKKGARKESENSDKAENQPRKSKKTKGKDRSKTEAGRQDSFKKTKGKKEKKLKENSLQEVEAGLEDNTNVVGDNTSPRNTPPRLDDEVSEEKKTEEEIYRDVEAEVEELLRVRTEKKIRQARLIAFENMLGCGIERMLSIVDTMRNFHDYRPSKVYPGEKNCCQEDWN